MSLSKLIVQIGSSCLLVAVVFVSGCTKNMDAAFKEYFSGPPTKVMAAKAFDPDSADNRREGVVFLANKDFGLKEPYLKGYAMLLRTDDDPLVRSAAARALGKAGDVTYLSNVVRALGDRSVQVRWDATVALDNLVGDEAVDPLRRGAIRDESADVRAACAKTLRNYRTKPVAQTLRQCLEDEEFSVQYQAHESLVGMTGKDFGYDILEWPSNPLVAAGTEPETKKPWWKL